MRLTKQNMDEFSVPRYKFVGMSEITNMVEKLEYVNQSYQFTEREDLSRNGGTIY